MALLSQVSPGSLQTQAMEEEFQFLLCQGCQKELRNPKLLSCLHTLCADCLEENKPVGQCPICHTPIPQASGIPDQDNLLFANLQAKLSTYQKIVQGNDLVCDNCGQEGEFWCSDCKEFLCVKCFETHQRYLKRESHEAKAVRDLKMGSAKEFLDGSRKLSNLSCPNPTHANQMLSIYCRECQKPICCICALLDSRHTGKHCDIKVEIQQRQQELGSVSEELKKKEELFQDAYCNLKRKADHLDQVRNETQELIQKRVEQMVQLIREKEQELLEMVERQHHLGNEELEGKLQQTEAVLKRMGASKQLVEKMHLYASDQEVMDLHSFIKGSLEELRKLQPLAVGTSIQAGGFAKCKARLQALFERVTGEGEAAPARCTDNFSKAPSLSLPVKRKGVQTEAPAKVIKTEDDAGKWEHLARKHQQNLLEQPGTSSSTSSSSSCVTDSFSAAKAADLLENNIYKLCEPDGPTGCLDSSEGDDSDEESTDSSLPDNINSVSCESSEGDLLAFPAGSPRELDIRQASLLFFDLKFLTVNKVLQLAVVDGEKSFNILIQPLKSLPGLISKGGVCEIGVKTLFHYLCSVYKPILAGYDLWSPALPVLFQSLDLLSKKEEFSATVFGFLDILPLIKEKIPKAGSYKLKNLANTYIWRQLSDNSPLDNAKALRDLCTVLEVDLVEDPRPVLTCSNLECYASLQPLLNEKLLSKPSVQMLSMHNVSLSKLHTLYLMDPEKGLQKFCRFFNSQLQSSEKKIRKLSKIKAHFQSPQPSAGHQAAAANELPLAIKSEPDY
ncbi:protein PML-like isoform X1 [Gopherus flavomarginatus]|uniref:protein PML-like isoform X1 n=1 Tax=Gopherus flavomarginatus TaxID=286002 RepID=UPI0021CBBECA|nr:protein PML-like isoform X1 [Gopherus flavomarginatus]